MYTSQIKEIEGESIRTLCDLSLIEHWWSFRGDGEEYASIFSFFLTYMTDFPIAQKNKVD